MRQYLKSAVVISAIGLMWVGGYLLSYAGDTTKTETVTAKSDSTMTADSNSLASHKIIAYYFYGNVRCATCRKIETYTKEAIDSAFADELKSGLLEFHATNIDSSQNEHFREDYKLYTKSVIIVYFVEGKQIRWKNLEKIWMLTGKRDDFHKYIQQEVQAYLDLKE